MQPIIFIGINFIGNKMSLEDNVVSIDRLTEQRAKEIIKEIIQDSSNVRFSFHVRERMIERGVTITQIMRVLEMGVFVESPYRSIKGNWKMTLSSRSAGYEIKVACALDHDQSCGNYAIVITTYIT